MSLNYPLLGDRGTIMPGQSVYEESDTPKAAIGTRLVLGERVFRYAKNGSGAALAAGKAVQSSAPVANHAGRTVSTAAIGARAITLALASAATADQYKDGTLVLTAGTGLGQAYKIKDHLVSDGSHNLIVNIFDELIVATAVGDTKGTLIANPYNGVIVVPLGGLSAPARGVPLIAVTASYYFWLQTAGPAPCLTQGTVAIGGPVGIGGTADGACGPIGADTTDVWGRVMAVSASTAYSLIDLRLDG